MFSFFHYSHPLIFSPRSPLPASPQPLDGGDGGGRSPLAKILKLSILKDEFLHHLREFLNQSTGFV